jgi:hypothetical protein
MDDWMLCWCQRWQLFPSVDLARIGFYDPLDEDRLCTIVSSFMHNFNMQSVGMSEGPFED